MNITLNGVKITQDSRNLAFRKNNLVDVMNITVDTDESYQYKIDVEYPVNRTSGEKLYNVIDLTRSGDVCTVALTADMLPFNGKYVMQLRGISGDKVYHTDTFEVWVKYSIDVGDVYNPVPSEFYQIEDNITSMNNHPPKPGNNGYWLVWNVTKQEYEESDVPLPDGTLPDITADTSEKYLSNDGKKAYWAEVQAGGENKIDAIEVNGVKQPIVNKTVNITVPTKTSDLSNDSGYITNEALDGYATKAELPTKVSQLENDSKYITASDAPVQSVNGKTGAVVSDAGLSSSIARYTAKGHLIDQGVPTENNHLANKQYVDNVAKAGNFSGNVQVGGDLTINGTASVLKPPTQDVDIPNKGYVDASLSDVVRKTKIAVSGNSSVNVPLSNGVYLLAVADNGHGGLVCVSVYPDGVTISGLVNLNGWTCARTTGENSVTLNNTASSNMEVYITSIGEGTYR